MDMPNKNKSLRDKESNSMTKRCSNTNLFFNTLSNTLKLKTKQSLNEEYFCTHRQFNNNNDYLKNKENINLQNSKVDFLLNDNVSFSINHIDNIEILKNYFSDGKVHYNKFLNQNNTSHSSLNLRMITTLYNNKKINNMFVPPPSPPLSLSQNDNNNLIQCILCDIGKDSQQIIYFENCEHYICRSCFLCYYEPKIREGIKHLKCPIYKCNKEINVKNIEDILPDKTYEKYKNNLTLNDDESKQNNYNETHTTSNHKLNLYALTHVLDVYSNEDNNEQLKIFRQNKNKYCPTCGTPTLFSYYSSKSLKCLNCLKKYCRYCMKQASDIHYTKDNDEYCRIYALKQGIYESNIPGKGRMIKGTIKSQNNSKPSTNGCKLYWNEIKNILLNGLTIIFFCVWFCFLMPTNKCIKPTKKLFILLWLLICFVIYLFFSILFIIMIGLSLISFISFFPVFLVLGESFLNFKNKLGKTIRKIESSKEIQS